MTSIFGIVSQWLMLVSYLPKSWTQTCANTDRSSWSYPSSGSRSPYSPLYDAPITLATFHLWSWGRPLARVSPDGFSGMGHVCLNFIPHASMLFLNSISQINKTLTHPCLQISSEACPANGWGVMSLVSTPNNSINSVQIIQYQKCLKFITRTLHPKHS